jgi:hypothetical protein
LTSRTFLIAAQGFTGPVGITRRLVFVPRFSARFAADGDSDFRRMDNEVASSAFSATRTVLVHCSEWARAGHRIGAFTNLRFRIGRFNRTIFHSAMGQGLPLIVSGILGWVAGTCCAHRS